MNPYQEQYNWVRKTRELLISYCETLAPSDYTRPIESFGGGSIRDLHFHVAECYTFWLGRFGSNEKWDHENRPPQNVKEMRESFRQVDTLVESFLRKHEKDWHHSLEGRVSWKDELFEVTPLWLYTHAMTHEFHHKGQIVSMSRHLGYTPVDTDLLDPSL